MAKAGYIISMIEWVDVVKIMVPALSTVAVAATGWLVNERSKRNWEAYKRIEKRYIVMLSQLDGFGQELADIDPESAQNKKKEFIRQLTLAWLYLSRRRNFESISVPRECAFSRNSNRKKQADGVLATTSPSAA